MAKCLARMWHQSMRAGLDRNEAESVSLLVLQMQRMGVDEVVTGGFKIHSQGDGIGSWCLLNRHRDWSSESLHLQESELGGMGS